MFEYLKGSLISVHEEHAILDVNGVGYKIHIPYSTSISPPTLGSTQLFYVTPIIREDAHRLFGFLTVEERNLFTILIDLPSVGPKTALHLVGRIPYSDLHHALTTKNIALLSRIPGIGKKTAERLILELPSKLPPPPVSAGLPHTTGDVLSALLGLGYSHTAAQKAIHEVLTELTKKELTEPPLPQFIALALKSLR